mgnify:CR=1 FL=1
MSGSMTAAPVPGVTLKTTKANNIHMRYAEIGSGPLVLFCHGWPESWYSWRHQLTAVSAAGFRCVAPDMRGYGGTEAPEPIDQYTLFHMVGDMAELVKALGESQGRRSSATIGARRSPGTPRCGGPICFTAVCAMSVPYAPPGHVDILTALEKLGINDFYLQYFQKPGVPEAELQQDIRGALRRIYFTAGGELAEKGQGLRPPDRRHAARQHRRSAGAAAVAERGRPRLLHAGILAHRLSRRPELVPQSAAQLGAGRSVARPADPPALAVHRRQPRRRAALPGRPVAARCLSRRPCPACVGSHILEGAGHWVQQERPAEVNKLLIDFLKGL